MYWTNKRIESIETALIAICLLKVSERLFVRQVIKYSMRTMGFSTAIGLNQKPAL